MEKINTTITIKVKSYYFINESFEHTTQRKIYFKVYFLSEDKQQISQFESDIFESDLNDYIKSDVVKQRLNFDKEKYNVNWEYDIHKPIEKIKIYCLISSKETVNKEFQIKHNWNLEIYSSTKDNFFHHYRKGIWQLYDFNTSYTNKLEYINKILFEEIKERFINQTPYEFKHEKFKLDDYIFEFINQGIIGIEETIQLNKMYIKNNLDIEHYFPDKLMPISILTRIIEPIHEDINQEILISTDEGLKIIDKYLFATTYKLLENNEL